MRFELLQRCGESLLDEIEDKHVARFVKREATRSIFSERTAFDD
jgi:hypothetical protein